MRSQLAPVDLATVQRPVREELAGVHDELRRIIVSDFPLIAEVNEHLTARKGKLFRPTLLLLSARATGAVLPIDLRLAAVVELIHLATLVHDDSVDHSVLRRGQPTINALFSHQVAVIMGDYLYSRAIMELVEAERLLPRAQEIAAQIAAKPPRGVRMSKRLLKAAQRMELKDLLDMSASMQAISHQMADHTEAVNAFLDKREPRFVGD